MIIAALLTVIAVMIVVIVVLLLINPPSSRHEDELIASKLLIQDLRDTCKKRIESIYKLRKEVEFQADVKQSYYKVIEQIANCNHGDKQYEHWARMLASTVMGYNDSREKFHAENK